MRHAVAGILRVAPLGQGGPVCTGPRLSTVLGRFAARPFGTTAKTPCVPVARRIRARLQRGSVAEPLRPHRAGIPPPRTLDRRRVVGPTPGFGFRTLRSRTGPAARLSAAFPTPKCTATVEFVVCGCGFCPVFGFDVRIGCHAMASAVPRERFGYGRLVLASVGVCGFTRVRMGSEGDRVTQGSHVGRVASVLRPTAEPGEPAVAGQLSFERSAAGADRTAKYIAGYRARRTRHVHGPGAPRLPGGFPSGRRRAGWLDGDPQPLPVPSLAS